MKKALMTIAVLAFVSSIVWAGPFINEPKDHWPINWDIDGVQVINQWKTDRPYQRNIHYNFNDPNNPTAVIYQGYDDDELYPSDWVEYDGLQYFDGDPTSLTTAQGLMGIDNRLGTGTVNGFITFHIDNWEYPRKYKHVWKEVLFLVGTADGTTVDPDAFIREDIVAPVGSSIYGPQTVILQLQADGLWLEDVAWKIIPNVEWEEITIYLTVPEGGYAFIDDVHFATECVPEPATMTLAVLGIGALAALRRRKR